VINLSINYSNLIVGFALCVFLGWVVETAIRSIRARRLALIKSSSVALTNWPQGPGRMLRRPSDDPQAAYAEYAACIDDLVCSPTVQMLDDFKHHQHVSRLDHCLNVSFTSYSLCKTLGWDYLSAARGGLLHDLFLYDCHTATLEAGKHGFVHPRIALNNANEEFVLNKLEEDIILKHMFPLTWRPPGYRESVLVCLVDKCCAVQELLIFGLSARSCMNHRHVNYLELLQGGTI
jgi:uncharacterized protein